jgi:hypothetical protein
MKAHEDPKILFDQLAYIQSAYNHATWLIDREDLAAVALKKAPDEYMTILTAEQRTTGPNLALVDLRRCVNLLNQTHSSKILLISNQKQSKFNGIYGYCKKPGRMAGDCRKKKGDQGRNNTDKREEYPYIHHCQKSDGDHETRRHTMSDL